MTTDFRFPVSSPDQPSRYDFAQIGRVLPFTLGGLLLALLGIAIYTRAVSLTGFFQYQVVVALVVFLAGISAIGFSLRPMRRNVGIYDSVSRVAFGLGLIVAGVVGFDHFGLVIGSLLLVLGISAMLDNRPYLGGTTLVVGLICYGGLVFFPNLFAPFPETFSALVFVLIGLLAVQTAIFRRCPFSLTMGVDTCSLED